MKRIPIDFGRPDRPYALPVLRLVLVAMALGGAGLVLQQRQGYRDAAQAWHAEREAEESDAAPPAPMPEDERVQDRIKFAAKLRDDIDAPWEALFLAVETVPRNGVALQEWSTDAATRDMVLAVEARDLPAMHLYLQQLGAAPGLTGVHLAAHQVQAGGTARPVRFTINASWRALRAQAGAAVQAQR